jgi:DNA replication protein DnaC
MEDPGYEIQNEYPFDARDLALKECPRCKGKGSFTQKRADGTLRYLVCPCVLMNQNRLASEIRIQQAFPGRMGRMTFATYNDGGNKQNKQAVRIAKRFVENWPQARKDGWILGFYGHSSAGKTHIASAIAIACVKRYLIKPYILSMPRLLEMQKKTFRAEMDNTRSPLDEAIEADLLVLDDLGAEYTKTRGDGSVSWAEDFLYQILDERIKNDRPIIYTTNYSKSGMKERLPMRIYERLARNQVIEPQEVIALPQYSRVNYESRKLLLGDDDE